MAVYTMLVFLEKEGAGLFKKRDVKNMIRPLIFQSILYVWRNNDSLTNAIIIKPEREADGRFKIISKIKEV
jgi:hypothetical protein